MSCTRVYQFIIAPLRRGGRCRKHPGATILSPSLSYVQSDANLFTSKIEQPSVLIHNAYRQIRNDPCGDWKVNDLRGHSRYLISWVGLSEKIHVSYVQRLPLLYAPAVTLHSTRIMFTFMILIGSSDSCHRSGSNARIYSERGRTARFSWCCRWRATL